MNTGGSSVSRGMTKTSFACAIALTLCLAFATTTVGADDSNALSVQITSPLGRTGIPGTIRIVARVRNAANDAPVQVRFFVDETLIGELSEGPPYALPWVDANPFEPANIRVEALAGKEDIASDSITLTPLELVDATEVSSVLLEASVEDLDGYTVSNLTAGDFVLMENDVRQPIDQVFRETLPATFTILVDSSQSMHRRLEFVREAASGLTDHLRENDRVAIVPFSKEIGPVTGPTDDRETVQDAISAIQATGGTAIVDSVKRVSSLLSEVEGRHAILLITDGYDEHSESPIDEAVAAVKGAHATLYVIGVPGVAGISLKGAALLRNLAEESGGRAFFPSRHQQLANAHELVSLDVFHRYMITYTPLNQQPDGLWREISLTTTNADHSVRTRAGYMAPAPPPVRPSLEFTITDYEQRHLDVSMEDLVVVEDGIPQEVDVFNEAVDPVSIILALDASGSMKKSAESVMDAARTFVNAVREEDSLAVVMFADRPVFAHDLTTTRVWSFDAIDGYEPLGGTALYDTVFDSLARLRRVDGRKVVVVLTDGRDEDNPGTGPGSKHSFGEVLERLREIEATVFCIGLGPNIDPHTLKEIAKESGGEVYFPQDGASLAEDYRRVIENLRRRYVITYTSTNSSRDGQWRDVEIRTRAPGTVVNSRGGYFAPHQ